MSKTDDVLAAIMAASRPQGCWAASLTGEAAEVVAKLREEEARGNKPSRVAVVKAMRDLYDVKISEDRVRNHLVGACSCD